MSTISPGASGMAGLEPRDSSSNANGYGSNESDTHRSPLSTFGFFKSSGDKKTRDGQPPKRRGPKPDSKPALTRRQELNRQAQRTHRERKELYIKALEQEVLRLKEIFASTTHERDTAVEEVRRLKDLLRAHGINPDQLDSPMNSRERMGSTSYTGSTHSDSVSGSYGPGSNSTGLTSPPLMPGHAPPPVPGAGQHDAAGIAHGQHQHQQPLSQQQPIPAPGTQQGMDYDQIGIDFVLTLERPCMDHMQYLMVRSNNGEEEVSGHALMATCPPDSHVKAHPEEPYPHKVPDVKMADLMKLLDLSNRLPLDGEITPVMAWVEVMKHPRFRELNMKDFEGLRTELLAKVRCYGFGAVLEEFEVRDAVESVFMNK